MDITDSQKHKALELSSKISEDFDEIKTEEFAKKHMADPWYNDFKLLFNMITDKHYMLDKKTYMVIAGALAYVVFPMDIIPDFLLGAGFLDDAFVIGIVMKQLSEEIAKYRRFKGI